MLGRAEKAFFLFRTPTGTPSSLKCMVAWALLFREGSCESFCVCLGKV